MLQHISHRLVYTELFLGRFYLLLPLQCVIIYPRQCHWAIFVMLFQGDSSKSPLDTPAFHCQGTPKAVPSFPSFLFNVCHFPRILPNLRLISFRTAFGSLLHPPFDLSSSSVLLLKWENDGRTMGELRNEERRKRGRTPASHQDEKLNKTVIIILSVSQISALASTEGLLSLMTDLG